MRNEPNPPQLKKDARLRARSPPRRILKNEAMRRNALLRRAWLRAVLVGLALGITALGQTTRKSTVMNEEFLVQYAATHRFNLGKPNSIKLTRDGSAVLFLRSGPRSFVQDLYQFDVASGKETKLLT